MTTVREDLKIGFDVRGNPFGDNPYKKMWEHAGHLYCRFGVGNENDVRAKIVSMYDIGSGNYRNRNNFTRIGLDDQVPDGTTCYRLFSFETNSPQEVTFSDKNKSDKNKKVREYPSGIYLAGIALEKRNVKLGQILEAIISHKSTLEGID